MLHVNDSDDDGYTALNFALLTNKEELTQLLLRHGASTDPRKSTPRFIFQSFSPKPLSISDHYRALMATKACRHQRRRELMGT
jgi:ankyrin repeat protein